MIEKLVKKVEALLEGRKLLWLSLTGSIAFGWGDDTNDYDIHGVFYDPEWFDYLHYGGKIDNYAVDLNLHELRHILYIGFYHPSFETLMNVSNPIYINDKNMWDLFNKHILSNINHLFFYRSQVENQLMWLSKYFSPRTCLHTYRVILQPIYYVKTRRIGMNIFEINEQLNLGLKGIYLCRAAYQTHQNLPEADRNLVWDELNKLLKIYDEEVQNKAWDSSTNWYDVSYREWYVKAEEIIKKYFGVNKW